MTSATVHVNNISPQTTEKSLREFFSFCGKIDNLSLTPASGDANSPQSATITFERDSAAKTAILLDGTALEGSPLSVASTASIDEIASGHVASHSSDENAHELRQEDKPRSTIFAEYLAHGYAIGDGILQRGIELDQKNGISARFLGTLNKALSTFDEKTHATERAKTVDTQYGLTAKAGGVVGSFGRYFEKAINTPTGQRIRSFYEQGGKQVLDIHNEAKRLAELKIGRPMTGTSYAPQDAGDGLTKCQCGGEAGTCGCAPGTCACDGCTKKSQKNEPVFVGPEKTTCACGGSEGVCGCEAGKCACAGCEKKESTDQKKEAEGKASTGGQLEHAAVDAKAAAADLGISK